MNRDYGSGVTVTIAPLSTTAVPMITKEMVSSRTPALVTDKVSVSVSVAMPVPDVEALDQRVQLRYECLGRAPISLEGQIERVDWA